LETFVDSSVLLDLFTEDERWLSWSQEQLTLAAQQGAIVLNAVVLAEIAPRFPRIEALRSALPSMAVVEEIPPAAAFLAGHAHADYRCSGGAREAVLSDFLIGAHAAVRKR
jgi:predicted nucleic acid-binding protein